MFHYVFFNVLFYFHYFIFYVISMANSLCSGTSSSRNIGVKEDSMTNSRRWLEPKSSPAPGFCQTEQNSLSRVVQAGEEYKTRF